MYKSPIEKIYGEIHTQLVQEDENMVMKAIRKVGVNVDKEELIKALQYDRNQYTKGYEDGKNEVLDKIRSEITDCLKALDEIEKSGFNIYLPNEISGRRLTYQQCLEFIDKYKAESEE